MKLTAIRIGMTIGGTNQPFMARLLRRIVLVKAERFASAALASSPAIQG
jgi:hypothetical protein